MSATSAIDPFDVIVVGAGPAGSAAALLSARAGLKVLLLERGEYPGAKNVSGAVFYGSAILNQLIPQWWEQAPVERYVTRRDIAFMSPTTAVALDFRCAGEGYATAPYNGFTVLRPKFDRWLAAQAEAAGAFLLTSTVVDDVLRDNGRIVGVRVRREQGEIYGKVIIACDGVNSFLAKKAGLQREFHAHELSLGVKEVIGLDPAIIQDRFHLTGNDGIAFEYLGAVTEDVHGGAFLYTNRDSLSLGVIGQVSSLVERRKRPYELLEGFKAHPAVAPLVRGGKLREYSAHLIPESGLAMQPKLYTDGLLIAGDAAGFCLAAGLYLEGMNYAMQSGLAAAETAIAACQRGDCSARSLSAYRKHLKIRHVSTDFRAYRHAPAFVNGPRLQNFYPELIARSMENLFRVDGSAKRKLLPLSYRMARQFEMRPGQLFRDVYQAARAFLW